MVLCVGMELLSKDVLVLYALYVHCTQVRLSYVINFYLLTLMLFDYLSFVEFF